MSGEIYSGACGSVCNRFEHRVDVTDPEFRFCEFCGACIGSGSLGGSRTTITPPLFGHALHEPWCSEPVECEP